MVTIENRWRHSRECTTPTVAGWVCWGWYWCAHSGTDVFQAACIHGSGGCDMKRFWGGDRHVHHVMHVTILGVILRPMSEAEVVVVVNLVGEARHPSVLSEFFLTVEVEPRVPCMCTGPHPYTGRRGIQLWFVFQQSGF